MESLLDKISKPIQQQINKHEKDESVEDYINKLTNYELLELISQALEDY